MYNNLLRLDFIDITVVINNITICNAIYRKNPKGVTMGSSKAGTEKEELFINENRRAEDFIEAGDLPSAARILVGIVEKDLQNWRAFNNMGIISWDRSAWADAYTSFKHACELKPDYTDALINLFDAALKLRLINDALPLFKKALDTDPKNEEIKAIIEGIEEQGDEIYVSKRALIVGIFNPRIEEAHKLLEDGQLNQAMEQYLLVNDEEGPNAEVFNGLGIISFYQKRYKDAFTLFFESIKLNPLDPDTYLNFLDAAKECGNLEAAKKLFELNSTEFPELKKIAPEFEKIAGS